MLPQLLNQTPEIVGAVLLFIPYVIILFPFFHDKIVESLQKWYMHQTPRDQWNSAVDQHKPRRFIGYLLSLIFLYTPCCLLLLNNHVNAYIIDIIQYFIYVSFPIILSILRPPSHQPCDLFDLAILSLLIVPMEISQQFDSFLPDITFTAYSQWDNPPQISVLQISAFNVALFVFYIFRPLQNIGLGLKREYCSRISWISFRFCIASFMFLLIAIPFALLTHFISDPNTYDNAWRDILLKFILFFFLTALPVEFLFRGILQNELHAMLDYRHQSRAFLRGRNESLTHTISQFEDDANIHAASRSMNAPSISVHKPKDSSQKWSDFEEIDVRSLPYYDHDDAMSSFAESRAYLPNVRDTFRCANGFCYFARFDYFRDWIVILVTAILYSLASINYKYDNAKDLVYAFLFMAWLGVCCGWLYRHCNSCLVSAVLQAVVVFVARHVYNNAVVCNATC